MTFTVGMIFIGCFTLWGVACWKLGKLEGDREGFRRGVLSVSPPPSPWPSLDEEAASLANRRWWS